MKMVKLLWQKENVEDAVISFLLKDQISAKTVALQYCGKVGNGNNLKEAFMNKEQLIKELEEYLSDADKAISEDEEYIRGWKSALLVALELAHNLKS